MLLLDSSVFIRWGRQRQDPAILSEPYLQRGELAICEVVRAEVLRGAIPLKGRLALIALFGAMNEIETDAAVWERTISVAWALDRKGQVLPLTDLIIAACALENDAAVVTFDGHFNHIPGPTVYSDLP